MNPIDCLIELKELVNNLGRTNIITRRQIEELFIKHEINLKKLYELKK